MTAIEFVVTAGESGARLDVVLAARSGLSRSAASALTTTVDGARASKSTRLEAGQRVVAEIPDENAAPEAQQIDLAIVYEDDDVIVIDKPAGLVVHPAPGHDSGTLVNALLARAQPPAGGEPFRPGIVHRLDAGTSGLIVVAKTAIAFGALSTAVAAHAIRRTYRALVEGSPSAEEATIDAPIGRSRRHRKKMAVVANGRDAVTHYRVVERFAQTSLLDVRLETGRTHQIRVHLSEIGHPVAGDPVYGRSRALARSLALTRPFLHAWSLAFDHPSGGRRMSFDSPLPEDLQAALAVARR